MPTVNSISYLKRFSFTLCVLAMGVLFFAPSASAAEPRKGNVDWNQPIAVASIASIDRVLEDIDYLFETTDKPEYPAMIKGFLAQYRNLEGLDKSKPLGVFVFLEKGISPQPVVVGFVPIKDLDELTETLGEVGFQLSAVDGKKDRYQLALPNFSLHLKMAHGYAFVQLKSEALDREFYNPDNYTKALAAKYDIAGSLLLQNVPEPMRMMAVDLARAKIDEELDRKPAESDVQYLTRKKTSLSLLNQFELVANDGKDLTVGYSLSKEKKQILVQLGVNAKPGTQLEAELNKLSQSTSQYSYLTKDSSDYLGYVALPLYESVVQEAIKFLNQPQPNIPPILIGDEANPGPVGKILNSAKATLRTGKIDGHIQMLSTSKGKQALIAALKISDGDQLKEGQLELFEMMKQSEDSPKIEENVSEINGVTIHKIIPKTLNQNAKDLFGENAVIFIGCSSDEFWWAIGGEASLDQLKKAISDKKSSSSRRKSGSVFLISIKMKPLISLTEKSAKNQDFIKSAKVAFASGGDLMTFYPKITGNQASLNLELGEGFVRLISLAIANRK